MDVKLKNRIEDILEGRATVQQAQEYLTQISEDDIKKLIPEDKLSQMLAGYRERNNFQPEEHTLHVSEMEKAEIWQRVKTATPFYLRLFNWLKQVWADTIPSFQGPMLSKYSMAAAMVAIILVISPVIFQMGKHHGINYTGTKGDDVQPQAVLQFAIVRPDGELLRPDRTITEKDTLAFRISAIREGFCSLYVIYNDHIDKVVADRLLSSGVHDLDVGYNLTGNKGQNILVMLFADAPISVAEKGKQRLILESARNNVSSITIGENVISITYQQIEIK